MTQFKFKHESTAIILIEAFDNVKIISENQIKYPVVYES